MIKAMHHPLDRLPIDVVVEGVPASGELIVNVVAQVAAQPVSDRKRKAVLAALERPGRD
jgi:hypothetical protein